MYIYLGLIVYLRITIHNCCNYTIHKLRLKSVIILGTPLSFNIYIFSIVRNPRNQDGVKYISVIIVLGNVKQMLGDPKPVRSKLMVLTLISCLPRDFTLI